MKRWVTWDDGIDIFHKSKQRGLGFILSKLKIEPIERTHGTFNEKYKSADWHIIPEIKERWNFKVSGNKNVDFKKYLVENYL